MNCNILSIFSLCIQSILWYFFFGCLCISCVSCRWPVVMWPLPNLAIKVALLVCSVFTLPTTHGRSCDKVLKFCLCSCNCLYLCKWCMRAKTKRQLVVPWPTLSWGDFCESHSSSNCRTPYNSLILCIQLPLYYLYTLTNFCIIWLTSHWKITLAFCMTVIFMQELLFNWALTKNFWE